MKIKPNALGSSFIVKIRNSTSAIGHAISRIGDSIYTYGENGNWAALEAALTADVSFIEDTTRAIVAEWPIGEKHGTYYKRVLGIWDKITGGIKGSINIPIGLINGLIRGFNKISFDLPDWKAIPAAVAKSLGSTSRSSRSSGRVATFFMRGLPLSASVARK
ncbi:MAG: hypothetical protein GX881_08020 [Firmicutes bacterium]|nr:hypothetical protein [Bacillota bacterium]